MKIILETTAGETVIKNSNVDSYEDIRRQIFFGADFIMMENLNRKLIVNRKEIVMIMLTEEEDEGDD